MYVSKKYFQKFHGGTHFNIFAKNPLDGGFSRNESYLRRLFAAFRLAGFRFAAFRLVAFRLAGFRFAAFRFFAIIFKIFSSDNIDRLVVEIFATKLSLSLIIVQLEHVYNLFYKKSVDNFVNLKLKNNI